MLRVGMPVWFYPGKVPAMVNNVVTPTMGDVIIDEDGAISARGHLTVNTPNAQGEYIMIPVGEDMPDLDRIQSDAAYAIPGQQGGADMGGPSEDDGA